MPKRQTIPGEDSAPTYICELEECGGDMHPTMYIREPFEGIVLECMNCDREVDIVIKHRVVNVP